MTLTTIPFVFALAAATTAVAAAQTSLSLAPEAVAQERAAQQKAKAVEANDASKKARRTFLPHTSVIGHAVTATTGDATVEMGKVADLVVDSKSGDITHVILEAGKTSAVAGQLRAVPTATLKWETNPEGATTATLSMAARAFEAMPAFDAAKLETLAGATAVDAAAKRVDQSAKDMTDKEKAAHVATARKATAGAARSVLLTNLGGVGVHGPASGAAFARVGELVLDCSRSNVAFATVAVADAQYLVPFSVLKVKSEPTRDAAAPVKFSIMAPTDAEGMASAPKLEGELAQMITKPRYRASINKHYGVEPRADKAAGKEGPVEGPAKERVRDLKKAGKRKAKKVDRGDG